MSKTIEQVFGKPRVLLPVIHPVSREAALGSVATAVEAGADGVFLINQGMGDDEVLGLAVEVAGRFAGLWLGVNLLGCHPSEVVGLVRDLPIKGIWSDTCDSAAEAIAHHRWSGVTFGGLAFKYQREVPTERLADEARRVAQNVDVPTTSGPGTGHAASAEKVATLKAALEGRSLGLASGVTPENVAAFLPHVDAYLVATGIEREFGVLDPEQTQLLARRIRGGA